MAYVFDSILKKGSRAGMMPAKNAQSRKWFRDQAKRFSKPINMHYLPWGFRARLMDSLYTITTNKRYDENTKLKISYQTLNAASKFKFFKPCVKKYLTTHVRSQFLKVDPKEWDIALFLPVERFQGAKIEEVWAKSAKQMKG